MPNLPHPDDELLAAYAGRDPDALADSRLAAHLSTCERCRPIVDELSHLRGALSELPDLAPSRPLRLIPPVPAPAAARGGTWLRRLTTPAMAAGAALVLVGAVGIGTAGGLGGLLGQAASGAFQNVGENLEGAAGDSQRQVAESEGAYAPQPGAAGSPTATSGETRGGVDSGASRSPGAQDSPEISPTPAPAVIDEAGHLNGGPHPEQPWLTLLIAGAGLLVISAALRFAISPRAG